MAVAMPALADRLSHSPFLTALTTTLEALPVPLVGARCGRAG